MNRTISYIITNEYSGLRIDAFLRHKHYTTQCITDLKHLATGIMHNGSRAYVNEILEVGDVLELNWKDEHSSEKIPSIKMELDIVYEDEDLVIVNKPAGMPIHPSLNHYENTLANGLAYYYQSRGQEFVFRCMNRLDRDTTGAVLIAKNGISGGMLSEMVRERQIEKEYVALVQGKMKESKGIIDAPIARVEGSTIERTVDLDNGERAITHYEVIEYREESDSSLVACHLETGRTHQIRVHMKYIGHPLLGDFLYNPNNKGLKRQGLHCRSITLTHPVTGTNISISVPLPKDMARIN